MSDRREALGLADDQHGLVTRPQLLEAGLSEAQIRHRRRRGELLDVHRGVYRLPGSPPTLEQRALGACLACGPSAVASHRTAAALHGLLPPGDGPVEVTVPAPKGPEPGGVCVHRTARLPASDVRRRDAVPVTSVERTVVDLAMVIAPEMLEDALDEALRRRLTTPDRVLALLGRPGLARRPGSGTLRGLLHDRLGLGVPESRLERLALAVLRRYRLPVPRRQHECRVGGRLVRFDLAYPDQRLAIELEGRGPHWGASRRQSDVDRHNAAEVAGWRVLYFTWRDITERPGWVAITIGEALGLIPVRWGPARPRRSGGPGRSAR